MVFSKSSEITGQASLPYCDQILLSISKCYQMQILSDSEVIKLSITYCIKLEIEKTFKVPSRVIKKLKKKSQIKLPRIFEMGWFLELFGRRGKKCARCRKLLKKTEPVTQIEDKRF
jgi:hypothetical protein